jgi:hypothetical protein
MGRRTSREATTSVGEHGIQETDRDRDRLQTILGISRSRPLLSSERIPRQ